MRVDNRMHPCMVCIVCMCLHARKCAAWLRASAHAHWLVTELVRVCAHTQLVLNA